MRLEPTDISFIKNNFEKPEDILNMKDVGDILDEIDTLIVVKGFDKDYNLNSFGEEAQDVYDNIYFNNSED